MARALAFGPVAWLGLISYSLYLWHWPVIVLMTPATVGWTGWPLLVGRLGAMGALSCASYYLIERPCAGLDWGALHRRLHVPTVGFAAAGLLVTAVAIVWGTVGPPTATSGSVATAPAPVPPRVHPLLAPALRASRTAAGSSATA